MNLFTIHKLGKFAIATCMVVLMLGLSYTPYTQTQPREAHAALSVVETGANLAANAASSAANMITAAAESFLVKKEQFLDGLAFSLINIMIKQISRSIVTWINNGFEGSPAFVSDFRGFLLDVADQVAGDFITEIGLGFMCSPFKLDIQLALAIQYQGQRDFGFQCRLSDVVDNIEGFVEGDLLSGGWDGWFALTTQPENNIYGALAISQYQLGVRIRNARGEEIKLLDFGEGFLSFEECETLPPDEFGNSNEHCYIVNPGAVIEDQLNETLDTGRQRLLVADEINEILGALFAQLVQQVFTGAGGLLGLTSDRYSGGNGFTYLEAATSVEDETAGFTDSTGNPIQDSINVEEQYLDLQFDLTALIDNAEDYAADRYGGGGACSSRPLPNSLVAAREDAIDQIAISDTTLEILQFLLVSFEATNNPEEQAALIEEYLNLQEQGFLHNEVDIVLFELEVIGNQFSGAVRDIAVYTSLVDSDCYEPDDDDNDGGGGGDGGGDAGTF